jgi:hypothetical protein
LTDGIKLDATEKLSALDKICYALQR